MATNVEIRNFIKNVRIEHDNRIEATYAKKSDITAVLKFKGTVANFAALPANASVGDVYNVTAKGGTDENGVAVKAGDNVVKTATGWDNLGGTVDLSNYVQKDGNKVLSTNDFTDAYKNTIDGLVSTGGEANVIETVKVDGTALTPDANKAVNIDLSGKVDKVSGKQLSTNDFTDAYKNTVDGLSSALNTAFTNDDLTYIFAD